jgi:hypothetical protein
VSFILLLSQSASIISRLVVLVSSSENQSQGVKKIKLIQEDILRALSEANVKDVLRALEYTLYI